MKDPLWRTSPARWLRIPPVGFVRPCEPKLVDRSPAGPGWLHEVKHDGFRILVRKLGERPKVWSRRGTDFTDRFASIAEAVRGLIMDRTLIDGEAVVLRDDGRSDFTALRKQTRPSAGLAHRLRPSAPLWRRSARAAARVATGSADGLVYGVEGILLSEALAAEGAVVFKKASEFGLEGIVSKRAGSLLRSRRSRDWLKTNNPTQARALAATGRELLEPIIRLAGL